MRLIFCFLLLSIGASAQRVDSLIVPRGSSYTFVVSLHSAKSLTPGTCHEHKIYRITNNSGTYSVVLLKDSISANSATAAVMKWTVILVNGKPKIFFQEPDMAPFEYDFKYRLIKKL